MKYLAGERDAAMNRIRLVRDGDFRSVWPDNFSDDFPNAITANFVDIAARDVAANVAPLPTLRCSAGSMRTDADRKRAERKNRIGFNYWLESQLELQMKTGADQYLSYGFLPIWVEADYKRRMPIIHVEDPQGAYYDLDRWGKCRKYARTWTQDINELAALYPEAVNDIFRKQEGRREVEQELDCVRYIDDKCVLIYLPGRGDLVVAYYEHRLPFVPVHIAPRPGLGDTPRGVYDDVIFVQMAHQMMAALTLEAGHKAVQAPIVIPPDVNEVNVGPDALMVTEHGTQSIGRLQMNVPPAAFELGAQLKDEMSAGAGYPDTRLGTGPAGGSTGRGISALEGGFDAQIKQCQDVLGLALKCITEMCFQIDVVMWPDAMKRISGLLSGKSFELTYKPARDIGDTFECAVTYGFASGLSPASAIVTMLQLRGDAIISRNTFRQALPFGIDVDQEQRDLDVQEIEDAFKQGLSASLTAVGQMMAAGQTQAAMQVMQMASSILAGRQDGVPLADLIKQAMQPQDDEQAEAGTDAGSAPGQPGAGGPAGPGGADIPGMQPSGLMDGVAAGQAAAGPGGRPSIQDLTAGFTGAGNANMAVAVRRRVPTG